MGKIKPMKTVVFYEHAEATMEKFMEVFPGHQAVEDEFIKAEKFWEQEHLQFLETEQWRFLLINLPPKNL